jgi:hypothetical protein
VIVDGAILNGRLEKLATDKSILTDVDKRLDPASIAAVRYPPWYSFELNGNISLLCRVMCTWPTKTGLHGHLNLTVRSSN